MDMLTTPRKISIENVLFALALLLALGIRFVRLGELPLTNSEARLALQALQIARGSRPLLGTEPLYQVLTAAGFFVFGASNFMARFWPALSGSLLVLAPLGFQKMLGRKTAIILSFLLVFEPGLWAISRQSGGAMLAVSLVWLCLAAWQGKRLKLAGVLGGLALLGGPNTWFGLLGLGLAVLLYQKMTERKTFAEGKSDLDGQTDFGKEAKPEIEPELQPVDNPWRTVIFWGIGTLLLVGTGLLYVPNGLSAWAGSLVTFLGGWGKASTLAAGTLLAAILVYNPLVLVFALVTIIRGFIRKELDFILPALIAGVALLLALVYPSRQTLDLVWVMIPLGGLAAMQLARALTIPRQSAREVGLTVFIVFLFSVFAWLDVIDLPGSVGNPTLIRSRYILLAGSMALLVFSLILIGLTWESKTAWHGLNWGGVIVLGLFSLSAGVGAAGLRVPESAELWQPEGRFNQAALLQKTMNELSDWNHGTNRDLGVTLLSELNSPSLAWELRDWTVTVVNQLDATSTPDLILSLPGTQVKLPSVYKGENFVLSETPVWDSLSTDGWFTWLAFRRIQVQKDLLVLWARDDLFVDTGQSQTQENP